MRWERPACLAALALLLPGCASMSEQECLASNWQAIGYEDGVRGQPADRIGRHRKACAQYSVTPDLAAYQAGRAEGLKEFCRPQNGFQLGSRGGSYFGVCSDGLEENFAEAFRVGRQLYEMESSVRTVAGQIGSRRQRLDSIGDQLTRTKARLTSEAMTPDDRIRLIAKIEDLAGEQGRLEAELIELVAEKARREEQLVAYRRELRAYL
jgi:hypothetical protein